MNPIDAAKPPRYTNALINESSPYLLQHAHNPVNWYPWGEQAFEIARTKNKPILLSIGYAACHWCHVMAHESFEDEQIAAYMNEHFICIKVDREERPDIDRIYMAYVQISTGSGGWPLNVFLTPDQEPFFGGTYFPPADGFNLPSWLKVLTGVTHFYHHDKVNLQNYLSQVHNAFQQNKISRNGRSQIDPFILTKAAQELSTSYDPVNGGFGSAPKFPAVQVMSFLLHEYKRTGNDYYLKMVTHSLRQMARGGIYDQLAGGFARYAVDNHWLVPHFEKMLYDNAQLSTLYLETYLVTHDDFFLTIARETLEFVRTELYREHGGFYSSLDADSEGVEGKFYLWTRDEVDSLLGNMSPVIAHYFDITAEGNFAGQNILHVHNDLASTAARFKLTESRTLQILNDGRYILLQARSQRIRPALDYKIVTSWNALMLSAFAQAYQILRDEKYKQIVIDTIQFIRKELYKDGRLQRTYGKGQAKYCGFLEDYALLIKALWDAYEAIFDIQYLEWAKELLDYSNVHFWDEQHACYFYTSDEQSKLYQRLKDDHDDSLPSGAAIMILNNLRFYSLTDQSYLQQRSEQILQMHYHSLSENPYTYCSYLLALDYFLNKPKEIVLALPDQTPATQFYQAIFSSFQPNKVVFQLSPGQISSLLKSALFQGKHPVAGKLTAYVCHNFNCSHPVHTVQDLKSLLH